MLETEEELMHFRAMTEFKSTDTECSCFFNNAVSDLFFRLVYFFIGLFVGLWR